jgi:hypothetical protein
MTTRTTLYTKDDIPTEDVEGESYNAIYDYQYNAPLDLYVAKTVHLPKNSQGEDWIPIFDAKSTGLYFMRSMWRRKQIFCALGPDGIIGVQAVSWVKLLLFDSSCPYLQRLFASFLPIYAGGRTIFLNRFTSDFMTINEALESVGKRVNSKKELVSNRDLYREKIFMVVFDMNWSDNNGPEGLGTLPGELDSTLIDEARLPSFHSVYPNLYFEFGLPGSKLQFKKD